jgi:hypothetical protein
MDKRLIIIRSIIPDILNLFDNREAVLELHKDAIIVIITKVPYFNTSNVDYNLVNSDISFIKNNFFNSGINILKILSNNVYTYNYSKKKNNLDLNSNLITKIDSLKSLTDKTIINPCFSIEDE